MNKKAGRPPLPKGESQAAQIAVRFKPALDKQLDKSAQRSGKTKAEVVRRAAIREIQNPPIWVKSKWKQEELDGQHIVFQLKSPTQILSGIGRIAVSDNALGEIAVDIFIDEHPTPNQGILTRIWLDQDAVDKIELNTGPDADKIKFKLMG